MATKNGSLSATGSVALVMGSAGYGDNVCTIEISGTYGTVTGTIDGTADGTNWVNLTALPSNSQTLATGTLSPSDNTSVAWKVDCTNMQQVRFRVTAIASGTLVVQLNSTYSVQPSVVTVYVASPAQTFTGAVTITSSSADALDVGPNGSTNPTLEVDASTSSAATGLKVKSAAAAAGLAVSVISSGTDENLTVDAKGAGTITFQGTATGGITLTRAVTAASSVKSTSASAGVGYGTGAGGTVTQGTSRATGVTLSKVCGQITTHNASLAAAAFADFIVTNTTVAATDTIVVNITPGGTGSPRVNVVNVAAGSFTLRVTNDHASTADTSADVINFAVLKAVAA